MDIVFLANCRRNINDDQRTYLIGKRYKEEKKEPFRPKFSQFVDHSDLETGDKSPIEIISKHYDIGEATVKRAKKFADAVDKVSENTGINPQKILSGEINASRKDIQTVAKYEPSSQKRCLKRLKIGFIFEDVVCA